MGNRYELFRNILHQFFFHAERGGATVGHQSDTVADTEHVCIYRHCRFFEYNRLDHIGSLSSYAGQLYQIFQIIRHLAIEVIHQHLCHSSANIKAVGQGLNTVGLVQKALRMKEEERKKGREYDQCWVVFDKDLHSSSPNTYY